MPLIIDETGWCVTIVEVPLPTMIKDSHRCIKTTVYGLLIGVHKMSPLLEGASESKLSPNRNAGIAPKIMLPCRRQYPLKIRMVFYLKSITQICFEGFCQYQRQFAPTLSRFEVVMENNSSQNTQSV